MSEIIFNKIPDDEKKVLLDCLGYAVNSLGEIILKETGERHLCPITKKPVIFSEASILPGSTVIINTNAFTLSEYFSRYIDSKE